MTFKSDQERDGIAMVWIGVGGGGGGGGGVECMQHIVEDLPWFPTPSFLSQKFSLPLLSSVVFLLQFSSASCKTLSSRPTVPVLVSPVVCYCLSSPCPLFYLKVHNGEMLYEHS